MQATSYKKKNGSAHVDQHGLQGIVTVFYKTHHDTYRNTYQISWYVSFVEKVYRYTPSSIHMKFSMTWQEKGDLLIQVTA